MESFFVILTPARQESCCCHTDDHPWVAEIYLIDSVGLMPLLSLLNVTSLLYQYLVPPIIYSYGGLCDGRNIILIYLV